MKKLKILLCLSCILYAIFIGLFVNHHKGFSQLVSTEYECIFIFINACTSYFFFGYRKLTWKVMGISLLLLTCFDTNYFPIIHNIFAIIFFVTIIIELKSWWILIVSVSLLFVNLYIFETFLIIILSIRNLTLLHRFG